MPELVIELFTLYRAAGRPSYRRISADIQRREDMPDTVSHETVGALINGTNVPRWSKVECVVRQLATVAVHRPDIEAEVRRFHELWLAEAEGVPFRPAVPEPRPAPPAESVPDSEPAAPVPQTGVVPPRNPAFTGRDDLLDAIAAALAEQPWRPLVLHGLGGVGKTSLAAEYAHRHAADYDVVWWIVAEQPAQTRAGLAALGERREWPTSADMRQTITTVLGELEGNPFRWLIVYDNAAGPEEIGQLLPSAGGHVLVTTRDAEWIGHGRAVPVDVLPRRDSIELLETRGGIPFDEADLLAERLGDLPLALEQAAALCTATGASTADYLRQLGERASETLSEGRPADYPATVAGAFGVTFAQVRRESPAAAQLIELLACLSAEPVSMALLRAAGSQDIPPPLGRLLDQQERLEEAVRLLHRYGLVQRVDDGQRIQVHRLVQLIVRDSLPEAELRQAYANARRLLVAANPGRGTDPMTWEMHAQLGPHIGPAEAVDEDDPEVRRVVLDHARYLYVIGDRDGSLRLSEQARAAWAGPADVWETDEVFACLDRIANAQIALGMYDEADHLLGQMQERLYELPGFGPEHPRTMGILNNVARVYRILGRYAEALALERRRVAYYSRTVGQEHSDTIRALGNLAVSLRTIGEYVHAYDIDDGLAAQLREARGAGALQTLFTVSNLARDLLGMGRYQEALDVQQESLPALQDRLNPRHESVILAGRTIAVCLRKTGRLAEALTASSAHFQHCQGQFGSDHTNSLAAAMTYANTVRAAATAGIAGPSIALAWNRSTDAGNRYRRNFGERNPLTLAAAVNHAAILRAMGERARARQTCENAYRLLLPLLGAGHPYTHAAAVGYANDLVAAHEEAAAAGLLRSTLDAAGHGGRESHPDTLICAINLGLVVGAADPEEGRRLVEPNLAELRRVFGPEHHQVQAAERGERGECDIEPPPT